MSRQHIMGDLLERPLVAKNRAFARVAYQLKGWKFDYTMTYNGEKRKISHIYTNECASEENIR